MEGLEVAAPSLQQAGAAAHHRHPHRASSPSSGAAPARSASSSARSWLVWFLVIGGLGASTSPATRRCSRALDPRTRSATSSATASPASPSSARSSSRSPAARRSTPTWDTSARGPSASPGSSSPCPAWCSVTSARGRWCWAIRRSPITPSSPWCRSARYHRHGRPRLDGHGHRLAGAHQRRLLAHPPGGAARLLPPGRGAPHLERGRGADLRPLHQLAARRRLRRPRPRLPRVEHAGRGLRHRRHRHDGHHDSVHLLRGQPGKAWHWSRPEARLADRLPRSSSWTSPSSAPTATKLVEGGWLPILLGVAPSSP